ncbi:hypothetical protein SDC9_92871 [bioreactor metagenome]|uniref:Uncharacterized protein n=1 Tax=bioreactor metagenome TaxID=1076179 RepID=A0A645A5N2_9ZZZZ
MMTGCNLTSKYEYMSSAVKVKKCDETIQWNYRIKKRICNKKQFERQQICAVRRGTAEERQKRRESFHAFCVEFNRVKPES